MSTGEKVRDHASFVCIMLFAGTALRIVFTKAGKYWKLPGGRQENNETPVETAVREVKEKTGVVLSAEELILGKMVSKENHDFFVFRVIIEDMTRVSGLREYFEGMRDRTFLATLDKSMEETLETHYEAMAPLIHGPHPTKKKR